MRLVCTNCGAQYEVPDDVIPQSGRDVQCSSCGQTWFQPHPDNDAGLAEELDEALNEAAYSDEDEAAFEHAPEPEPAPEPDYAQPDGESFDTAEPDYFGQEPEAEAFAPDHADAEEEYTTEDEYSPEDDAADPYADEWEDAPEPAYADEYEDAEEPAPAAAPMRRQLDPSISDLLREEAEREAKARASESSPLEHQPELGLTEPEDEASRRARESRARMARLRGQEEPETAPAQPSRAAIAAAATGAVAGRSRRDLLPDIEEINSTLRSASDRRPAEADDHDTPGNTAATRGTRQRSNAGRRAFAFMLMVFAFLLCLYVFAPQISRAVPALSDIMTNYIVAVNKLRIWLDGQVQQLMVWLDGKAAQSAGTTAPADTGN